MLSILRLFMYINCRGDLANRRRMQSLRGHVAFPDHRTLGGFKCVLFAGVKIQRLTGLVANFCGQILQ